MNVHSAPVLTILAAVALLIFSGCVNTPPVNAPVESTPVTPAADEPVLSNPVPSAGAPLVFCDKSTDVENEECFEDAFLTCQRAVATFWKTSDGVALTFESKGVDADGKCGVRVTVPYDSQSSFAGQSASCAVSKTSVEGSPAFDIYSIGPSTCTGSFVDAIQQSPHETMAPETPAVDSPGTLEFSFVVSDSDGPVGQKEFVVHKGDHVKFIMTTSPTDSSWGGLWVRAPAGSKLADESDYLFSTGTIAPGQTKTVEFVANESFTFAAYWPESNVEKGRAHVTVEE